MAVSLHDLHYLLHIPPVFSEAATISGGNFFIRMNVSTRSYGFEATSRACNPLTFASTELYKLQCHVEKGQRFNGALSTFLPNLLFAWIQSPHDWLKSMSIQQYTLQLLNLLTWESGSIPHGKGSWWLGHTHFCKTTPH